VLLRGRMSTVRPTYRATNHSQARRDGGLCSYPMCRVRHHQRDPQM